MFFFDGYDELVKNNYFNIYDKNKLDTWESSRFFIITRSYYFNQFAHDHKKYLYPHDENGKLILKGVKEFSVSPFTQSSKKIYIEKYLK